MDTTSRHPKTAAPERIPEPTRRHGMWLDGVSPALITSGELERLPFGEELAGTMLRLEDAIPGLAGESARVGGIRASTTLGSLHRHLYLELAAMTAERFLPVYRSSGGEQGLVSVEVHPRHALHAEELSAEVRHLRRLLVQPNVVVHVPGTPAGLAVVPQLVHAGVSVHVGLVFTAATLARVDAALLAALEARSDAGRPLGTISLFAGFRPIGPAAAGQIPGPECHCPATARQALLTWRRLQRSHRWSELYRYGARAPRLIWTGWTGAADRSPVCACLRAPDTHHALPLHTLVSRCPRDSGLTACPLAGEGAPEPAERTQRFSVDNADSRSFGRLQHEVLLQRQRRLEQRLRDAVAADRKGADEHG